jgi:adenylylsulfate kinase-like enzyme
VITGPIASGKSTVARELARKLHAAGTRTAVIDLDVVHNQRATGPSSSEAAWAAARHEAATLANSHLARGAAVVIADGSFNRPGDRADFARHLDAGVEPRYVTLLVTLEEALRRALADLSRGRSRDPAFLGPYFAAVAEVIATVPGTDIVIDTEKTPPASAAVAIASLLHPEATPERKKDAD